MSKLNLFDPVANIAPISIQRLTLLETNRQSIPNLPRGQVGTIVEVYESEDGDRYLVEFADSQGREYAMAILTADELLVLHYELTVA